MSTEKIYDRLSSKELIILRGLPGSGKSTFARSIPAGPIQHHWIEPKAVCSADDYFVDQETGAYAFNPSDIGLAHRQCFAKALHFTLLETGLVIIDNTNIHASEIAPYYLLGETRGYDVRILFFPCSIERSLAQQTHGVPEAVIRRMARTLETETLPPYWKVESK